MANVVQELTEQLAKKVGGDDIARGIVEGIQAQGGSRSSIQKELRRVISNIDADDAVKQAKFADLFTEGADGQVTLKGVDMSTPTAGGGNNNATPDVNIASNDGQISMFPDSTGTLHTPQSKIREIKEARQARVESNISEGDGGQMYMNFGYEGRPEPTPGRKYTYDEVMNMSNEEFEALSDADVAKYSDAIYAHDQAIINGRAQVEGQQSFFADKNGFLNTEEGVQQLRAEEVRRANRNWIERRIDGMHETWSNVKSGVSDLVTGNGDGSKLIAGRKTREAARVAANEEYMRTGIGSAQSKSEFRRNYKGNGASAPTPSTNSADYQNVLNPSSPASVAEQNAKGADWSGISKWVHDNQLITAGLVVGGAVIASELMDDEY